MDVLGIELRWKAISKIVGNTTELEEFCKFDSNFSSSLDSTNFWCFSYCKFTGRGGSDIKSPPPPTISCSDWPWQPSPWQPLTYRQLLDVQVATVFQSPVYLRDVPHTWHKEHTITHVLLCLITHKQFMKQYALPFLHTFTHNTKLTHAHTHLSV